MAGAATAAALSFAAPASAADSSTETVVVTGSRIPQEGGLTAASPLTAVGQDEIKFEGTTNVESLLNNLPSVFAGQQNFSGNASSGTATVDLRGLGSQRTLVLIDGLRLAPGDPVVPVPDLNQVPAALVERVDVLTGGASAVYGSDAIGGVVNFIMRKDFQGVEFDGTYSGNWHDNGDPFERGLLTKAGGAAAGFIQAPDTVFDGQGVDGTAIFGVNTDNGKGNITGYVGYHQTSSVLQSKRDYSACSTSNFRSHLTNPATGQRPYDAFKCAGSVNYDLFYSLTGPLAYSTQFMKAGGHLVPFSGASTQYYNYGPVNSLQRPDKRWTAGFFAHYQVDPMLELYSSFMFTDDHTKWQAAPSALFFGSGLSTYGGNDVNCDNPLAAGTDFVADFCDTPTSTATVLIGRRNVEGGPRVTDFRHTSFRMVVGARGDLGGGWSYDISAQHEESLYQQLYLHDLSKQKVQNALLVDPGTGKCTNDPDNCVPLDIFHGIGGITPAMLAYVYTHGQQEGSTVEDVVTGAITGDLGEWGIQSPWAKSPVGVSIGAEYRSEYLEETTSEADQGGDLYGAGGKALGQAKAGFDVREGFLEIKVPLAEDQTFFRELSLNGGYRFSSYSSAGDSISYKIGAEWAPVDDFRFRASFNRAVRAPNVLELFSPQNTVLGSYSDPCAGGSPTFSAAQCAATGVTAGEYGHLAQCPASQCNVLAGGNPNLSVEKSDTKTVGIVLTPTDLIPGFSATVDYFHIGVNNFIAAGIDPITVLTGCANGNTALCPLIHRDAGGHLFTFPNSFIVGTNLNTGFLKTDGIDIESNYNTDLADWGVTGAGSLGFNFIGTWVNSYDTSPYTGSCEYLSAGHVGLCGPAAHPPAGALVFKSFDCVGKFGTGCGTPTPEWRHKLRVTWTSPWDFSLSLDWRHLSESDFAGNDVNPFIHTGTYCPNVAGGPKLFPCTPIVAGGHISGYNYFDLAGTWSVSEGFTLGAGINNLFDKDPPLLASGGIVGGPTGPFNGNTFPGVYDPLGRYVYINGTLKL
jgi:iron complex outermembrane recepter protein